MAKRKQTKITKKSKKTIKKNLSTKSRVSSFRLLRESLVFLYTHKKILSGVTAVFFVLYQIMVRAGSSFDVNATQQLISDSIGSSGLFSKTLLTGVLIGSGANAGAGTNSLVTFTLLIIGSLAFIWAIRHLEAGKKFKVRDSYYSGMYPLVPFLIVILLISAQLIPFALGGFLYTTAEVNGIISSVIERILFVSAWGGLGLLSAYWVANSLIGIYAVTLPDIYPIQALRSTKKIVKGQRWSILLKLLVLAIFITIVVSIVLLLIIIVLPVAAVYAYDALFILGLLFFHVYMFKLYRSLI